MYHSLDDQLNKVTKTQALNPEHTSRIHLPASFKYKSQKSKSNILLKIYISIPDYVIIKCMYRLLNEG